MLTIRFEVTEEDYINFNIDQYYKLKEGKKIKITSEILSILLVFIVWVVVLKEFVSLPINIISFLITALLIILLSPKITDYCLRESTIAFLKNGKANDFIGQQTVKLTEDYIEDSSQTITSYIQYSAVEQVCFGHGLFYIYLGAVKVIIIPISAFKDEEEKNYFFDIIAQKTKLDLSSIKQIKLDS